MKLTNLTKIWIIGTAINLSGTFLKNFDLNLGGIIQGFGIGFYLLMYPYHKMEKTKT